MNSNNQLTNTGYSYDLAGNMTAEGSSYSYSFDAENRLTTASGGGVSGGPYTYVYDGNSLRVKKSNSAGGTLYWRSLSGDAIAETDLNGNTTNEYVFFGGRRIARIDSSGNVFFYYADHLGTTRSITNATGTTCYDAEFTPYGQEMVHTNNCPQNYKFTGYERDSETGLDYSMARFYNPRLGRFMSSDPLGGDLADPQSQDGYAYVRNSTTALVDPLGLRMNPVYFNDINPVANITSFTYIDIPVSNWDLLGGFTNVPPLAEELMGGVDRSGFALPGIVTPGPIPEPGDDGGLGGVWNKVKSAVKDIVCTATQPLQDAAVKNEGAVGAGVGGSAAAGAFFGLAGTGGVQMVADPQGNVGITLTGGGNPGWGVFGLAAQGGCAVHELECSEHPTTVRSVFRRGWWCWSNKC